MGSKKFWLSISVMMVVYAVTSPYVFIAVQGMKNGDGYDGDDLDSFIHDYAFKKMAQPRTGKVYNISLPSNYSGIEVSVVRLRSGSFWNRGFNHSFFRMPQRILPWPFVKRLDLVYQNLGNLSSHYYNVPNHTFVSPVIGLLAYDSNSSTADEDPMILLSVMGDPIQIYFPSVSLPEDTDSNVTLKCVRFDIDGNLEFSNTTKTNTCISKGQGHFSIVIPSSSIKKKKQKLWKWWVVGFAVGVAALLLLVGVIIILLKIYRINSIGRMERQSEKSEALDSIWIGRSRMPSASGIRTQPVLENSYVP